MNSSRKSRNTQSFGFCAAVMAFVLLALSTISPVATANTLVLEIPASIASLQPNPYARINEPAYQSLAKAQAQIDKQQPAAALKTLAKLITAYAQNPYIVSLALRSAAWIMLEAEQTEDAINMIETVIRLHSLDDTSIASLQHTLTQLYYHNAQYEKAAQALNLWLKTKNNTHVTSDDYYLLALAYYHLANCTQSISAAKQGLKMKPEAAEPFWQLILNCQLQQEDYQEAAQSLTRLMALQPNEIAYWTQWVSVQHQLQQPEEALAALELMSLKGWLQTEPLALQYVHLLAQQGNPARAAEQLSEMLQNKIIPQDAKQELYLAQLWAQAGETDKALLLFKHLKEAAELPEADLSLLDQWLAYLQSRQP